VYNNTLARLTRGIMVYDQNRGDKPSSGTTGNSIHDNKIVAPSNPSFSLLWTDDGQGSIITSAYNNYGSNNSYFYSGPEDGNVRFQWGSSKQFSNLSSFAATPGGAGSWYLSGSQSAQALVSAGIPAN
jgi:hypothetical protein